MLYSHEVEVARVLAAVPALDLADEAAWEDSADVEFISQEEAGLEESQEGPMVGSAKEWRDTSDGGIFEYIVWALDEEYEGDR